MFWGEDDLFQNTHHFPHNLPLEMKLESRVSLEQEGGFYLPSEQPPALFAAFCCEFPPLSASCVIHLFINNRNWLSRSRPAPCRGITLPAARAQEAPAPEETTGLFIVYFSISMVFFFFSDISTRGKGPWGEVGGDSRL